MAKQDDQDKKFELRVTVEAATAEAVRNLSEKRGLTLAQAVEHFVKVGTSRIRALKDHNLVLKARRKAEEAKKAAKKARAKARKTSTDAPVVN